MCASKQAVLCTITLLLSFGSAPSFALTIDSAAKPVIVDTPKVGALLGLEIRVFDAFNRLGYHNPWMNTPMKVMTGSLVYVAPAVPVGLYVYGREHDDPAAARAGVDIALTELGAGAVTEITKLLVQRPRPYISLKNVILPSGEEAGFSFPSGHSTEAFALGTSLSLHFPKLGVIIPSMLYATCVAVSRPFLGVHYTSDILIGALIGAGSAFLIHHYEDEILGKFSWALPGKLGTASAARAQRIVIGVQAQGNEWSLSAF